MTWFGIVLIVLFGFNLAHSVIRAADGGYTKDIEPGALWLAALFQLAIILGIIFIGTGVVA